MSDSELSPWEARLDRAIRWCERNYPPSAMLATLVLFVAIGLGVVAQHHHGGSSDPECVRAYRTVYLDYGKPQAIPMELYCKRYNDTSWLPDEGVFRGTYK